MKREGLAFLSAVQFLTRVPIPDPGWEEGRLDRAAKWFPLVGALVGLLMGLVLWISLALWNNPQIAAALVLLSGVLVTGALHEDGLADTADGLGGGRGIDHRLKIMKDSSIGAYGALALIFALVLRFAALAALCANIWLAVLSLLAAHTIGRAAMLPIIWSLPYARNEEDAKVAPLTGSATSTGMAVAGVTVLAVCLLLLSFGAAGVIGLLAAAITCLLMRQVLKSKLGGWTGDTAGAVQITCEIAFLLGVAAWI